MADQEFIRKDLSEMRKDMRNILKRDGYIERDMNNLTNTLLQAEREKRDENEFLADADLLLREELKEQLLIDDQTREKLLTRKLVPAIVKEADREKKTLRRNADAGMIKKLFLGISKEAKEKARKRLSQLNKDTAALKLGRENPGQFKSNTDTDSSSSKRRRQRKNIIQNETPIIQKKPPIVENKPPVVKNKPPKTREQMLQERSEAEKKIADLKQRRKSENYPFMPADVYEAATNRNDLTAKKKYEELSPEEKKMYDFLDECVKAYLVIKDTDEALFQEAEGVKRPVKHYNVELPDEISNHYERQKGLNCYCCAGTALYNQFQLNEKEKNPEFLNQYDMRSYVPDYLTKEEYKQRYAGSDDRAYKSEKDDIDLYCGANKNAYGNIFNIGDYYLKRRKDIAVQRSVFSFFRVSQSDPNWQVIRHNMVEKFKETIAGVLSTGNALALRISNHYITLVGLKYDSSKGVDMVKVLDSNDPPENVAKWKSLSSILVSVRSQGCNAELTWLRKIDDPVKLTEEYHNLEYKDGEFKGPHEISDEDVAHKLGVNVSKKREEKDADVGSYITDSIYVPCKYQKKPA